MPPYAAPIPGRRFTIESHGDDAEKEYWLQFASVEWPAYETFWQTCVVPLTYRVVDAAAIPQGQREINLRPKEDLAAEGFSDNDVAIAQLHYTALLHVGRVADIASYGSIDRDLFQEGFARLVGALDVADELLARSAAPQQYRPWKESDGERARRDWRTAHEDEASRRIRRYRNRLVHGRVVPEMRPSHYDPQQPPEMTSPTTFPNYGGGSVNLPQTVSPAEYITIAREGARSWSADAPGATTESRFPRIGRENAYLDWRDALAPSDKAKLDQDFGPAAEILEPARADVVVYLEDSWRRHLVQSHEIVED